jgi:cell division protein FtsQ
VFRVAAMQHEKELTEVKEKLSTKISIRKVLFTVAWLAAGAGLLTLLIAAIGKRNSEECTDYKITIKGTQDNFFVDKKDVERLLKASTKGNIKGQPMTAFNLRKMEALLEDNVWIRDAELFFDNQQVLHTSVWEREPVARIFTTGGSSYYIDSSKRRMPLSERLSARVPVFTNFPDRKVLTKKDSLLLDDVKTMAQYIMEDDFRMAQVSQVDITKQRTFEMVPVIGNHLVLLGNAENLEQKFNRLFIFYKQVAGKTGFDRYSTINVQFAGQVIGTKRGAGTMAVDSVQLRNNVMQLLRQTQQLNNDTITGNTIPAEKPTLSSRDTVIRRTAADVNNGVSTNPNPPKATDPPKPKNVKPKPKPRAVMPGRN